MGQKSLRVVQMSDIHLFADEHSDLLGVKTQESFEAAIHLLEKDPIKPNLIILGGDLSQDCSEASYIRIADMLDRFSVPTYFVAGNHDDSKVMARIFPRKNILKDKHIVIEDWQFILLDTQKHGCVEGYLDQEQLNFLQECLRKNPHHASIIVFHHHPFPVGCKWLDRLGLMNASEFWATIAGFQNVNYISFGHVHQDYEGTYQNISCFSTPSTCVQFKRNSAEFALEKLTPGYRWMDLYPAGALKTGVCRAAHYVGEFRLDAKGY